MRKYILIISVFIFLSLFLLTTDLRVIALTATNSASRSAKTASQSALQQTRLEALRTKAVKEIDRRLEFLNTALNKTTNAKKLAEANKTSLITLIQKDITDMLNLKGKIAADTDIATLRTDVALIVKDYRVYALLRPQVELIAAGDSVLYWADKLNEVALKLNEKIQKGKTEGRNTSGLQTAYNELTAKTAVAKTQAQSIETTELPLKPE